MFIRKAIWVLLVVIFVTENLGRAQRTYAYKETVGEGYDHETGRQDSGGDFGRCRFNVAF